MHSQYITQSSQVPSLHSRLQKMNRKKSETKAQKMNRKKSETKAKQSNQVTLSFTKNEQKKKRNKSETIKSSHTTPHLLQLQSLSVDNLKPHYTLSHPLWPHHIYYNYNLSLWTISKWANFTILPQWTWANFTILPQWTWREVIGTIFIFFFNIFLSAY